MLSQHGQSWEQIGLHNYLSISKESVNQIADEAYAKDLPKLSIHQIAFWDKMHKEQIAGYTRKKSYQIHCDPNDK